MVLMVGVALFILPLFLKMDMNRNQQRSSASLDAGLPEPVAAEHFSKEHDIHVMDEVHILGNVDPAYRYAVSGMAKRAMRGTGRVHGAIFLVTASEKDRREKVAYAAILTSPETGLELLNRLPDATISSDGAKLINGQRFVRHPFVYETNLISQQEGWTKSSDFIYIRLWQPDRQTALHKPSRFTNQQLVLTSAVGALICVLWLLINAFYRDVLKGRRSSTTPQ